MRGESPGVFHGADNVVAALDDHPWANRSQPVHLWIVLSAHDLDDDDDRHGRKPE
jgi:hypothetical protein